MSFNFSFSWLFWRLSVDFCRFYIDELPIAYGTIVAWHFGRLRIDKNGAVSYCGARDNECAQTDFALPTGQWHYASIIVRHASPGHEFELRLAVSAGAQNADARQFTEPITTLSSMALAPLTELGVRLGQQFNGRIDLLSIAHKVQSATVAAEFDATELTQFRDEIVPNTQPGLQFYCMFDLKRGAHLYDNVRLLRAPLGPSGALSLAAIALLFAHKHTRTQVDLSIRLSLCVVRRSTARFTSRLSWTARALRRVRVTMRSTLPAIDTRLVASTLTLWCPTDSCARCASKSTIAKRCRRCSRSLRCCGDTRR